MPIPIGTLASVSPNPLPNLIKKLSGLRYVAAPAEPKGVKTPPDFTNCRDRQLF
jgi:hypothetical protein